MYLVTLFFARSRSVARSGIRPMYQNSSRHRGVGADREHVPDQRAAELRPDAHRVRIRQQPVGRQPRPAGVDQREHQRAGDREERHRFGEAVDRRPPVLLEQQQDRRDQRAGVADADPPDEVDDVERPADRDVVAPDADALQEQVADRHQQEVQEQEPDQRRDDPRRPAGTSSARSTLILLVTDSKVCPGSITGGGVL